MDDSRIGRLHKEYHEENFSKQGDELQMVQLWVNLPAKFKMSTPKYQEITNDAIPKHILSDRKSYVEIIAGTRKNLQGKAFTFSEIHLMNAYLEAGVSESFEFKAENNTAILVLEGCIQIQNEKINENQLVLFKNEGSEIELRTQEKSIVLVLSAIPLNELIASYGPFVMNTQEEISTAIDDFRKGKFGQLN